MRDAEDVVDVGDDAEAVLGRLSVGEGRISGCCWRWMWRGVRVGVSGGVGGMSVL